MTATTKQRVRVTFQPEGRTVHVLEGSLLLEAAGRAGIVLDTPCGGQGTCGKCRVVIRQNATAPREADGRHFSEEELQSGVRLACRTPATADMVVEVPAGARLFEQRILTEGRGREVALEPTVAKHAVNLPEPSLKDQRADADRLIEAIGRDLDVPRHVLAALPDFFRQHPEGLTAVVAEDRIIALEAGDTTDRNYGIAFDIGTTTVAGFLMDLHAGREIAVAARTNPQVAYGDDVVARIKHAAEHRDGLQELQARVVACLNEIIAECCDRADIACEHLYEATVAGNTTMNHLLLGLNPAYVAQAPYVAVLRRPVNVGAGELGLRIHPHGLVHALPNIAGFVGSDTIGVILSAGIHEAKKPVLAVDIGTNGELVLGHSGRLIACSTAAGPAFEGARITFGMRAASGAIEKVLVNDDIEYNVIGDVPPRGLCGTALIDLVAELLRVGVIEPTGRILPTDELPASAPPKLRKRLRQDDNGWAVVVADAEETQIDGPILLTQRDIRELQLAKGAIAAGINILLREMELEIGELDHILLAGAFGNFIRRNMAMRIGLLPAAPRERIRYIGNAAGAGARLALLSRRCKEEADRISDRAEYLELAGRADFQMEFASAMMFPEA